MDIHFKNTAFLSTLFAHILAIDLCAHWCERKVVLK